MMVHRSTMKMLSDLISPKALERILSDAARERSDTTAVPAAGVILQTIIGWVLADAMLEKFGGDTLPELQERVAAARAYEQAY